MCTLFLFWCLQHKLAKGEILCLFLSLFFFYYCLSEFVHIPIEDSNCLRKPWIHWSKFCLVIYMPHMVIWHSESSRLSLKATFSPFSVTVSHWVHSHCVIFVELDDLPDRKDIQCFNKIDWIEWSLDFDTEWRRVNIHQVILCYVFEGINWFDSKLSLTVLGPFAC